MKTNSYHSLAEELTQTFNINFWVEKNGVEVKGIACRFADTIRDPRTFWELRLVHSESTEGNAWICTDRDGKEVFQTGRTVHDYRFHWTQMSELFHRIGSAIKAITSTWQ